jgi:hypothetical protein
MLLRQCIERSTVGLAFIASLLSAHLAVAQAPPSPEQPWAIPESAIRRAAALGDTGFSVPHKQYDLAALVDLAERENPKRGRLGKPRVKRPRVSASQKARIFRSFPCKRSAAFSTRRCRCPKTWCRRAISSPIRGKSFPRWL